MILYSSHNFSRRLKNSMILCSSKCNASENFKADINIMYRTAKNITNEKKEIKVFIFDDLINESILKLFDFKMIMISMKII